MFCKNCGKEINESAVACMSCGCDPKSGTKFCGNCGATLNPGQVVCVKCGAALEGPASSAGGNEKSRTVAAILALLFGAFGAHMFYIGNMQSALIRLGVSLLGFVVLGVGTIAMGIIAFVEAIIYFTKTDADFKRIYVLGKKGWF